MDTLVRRWLARIDQIAARPGRVQTWTDAREWPVAASRHLHPDPTAVLCLAGVVRLRNADGQVDLQAGDMLMLAPGVWHQHEPLRPGAACFTQGFLPGWSDVGIEAMGSPVWIGRLPTEPTHSLIRQALRARSDVQRQRAAGSWLQALAGAPIETTDHRLPVLQPMVELMWRRFHTLITAAELVRASGASRSTAYKVFTAWYGQPPREAILTCRLWLAEELLRQGLTVEEVASRCGFGVADTFARCWRRKHGVAPRYWRAEAPPDGSSDR